MRDAIYVNNNVNPNVEMIPMIGVKIQRKTDQLEQAQNEHFAVSSTLTFGATTAFLIAGFETDFTAGFFVVFLIIFFIILSFVIYDTLIITQK